jgi:hypothetical protein
MVSASMRAKTFNVHIEDRNGMLVATSEDIKGMLVAEYSLEALENAIPREVEDLFAACGVQVVVTMIDTSETHGDRPWVAISAEVAKRRLERIAAEA